MVRWERMQCSRCWFYSLGMLFFRRKWNWSVTLPQRLWYYILQYGNNTRVKAALWTCIHAFLSGKLRRHFGRYALDLAEFRPTYNSHSLNFGQGKTDEIYVRMCEMKAEHSWRSVLQRITLKITKSKISCYQWLENILCECYKCFNALFHSFSIQVYPSALFVYLNKTRKNNNIVFFSSNKVIKQFFSLAFSIVTTSEPWQ